MSALLALATVVPAAPAAAASLHAAPFPGALLAAIESPVHLNETSWRLAVVIGTFLAAVHAYRKLEPYFAVTWFGSGLVFGWFFTEAHTKPEALLLPVLVVYIAAAVTKGIVERGALAGNHVVHVLATGLFAALVALPLESAARAMHWVLPRDAPSVTHGVIKSQWLGGVPGDQLVLWGLVGTLFYGLYKILDHIGLGPVLQTVLLFVGMPFLVMFTEYLLRLMS
jgi:hypothetical protein